MTARQHAVALRILNRRPPTQPGGKFGPDHTHIPTAAMAKIVRVAANNKRIPKPLSRVAGMLPQIGVLSSAPTPADWRFPRSGGRASHTALRSGVNLNRRMLADIPLLLSPKRYECVVEKNSL
jgi:hypothetical protein